MKEETKKTKKFNKKYLAFGILGLFALVLVSAVVVDYLSNTASVDMEVKSAMGVYFNEGLEVLTLENTTARSTFDFDLVVENFANNEIIAPTLEIVVKDGKGTASCEDLVSVNFIDTWCHGVEDSIDCPVQDLADYLGVCSVVDGKAVYTILTEKYNIGQKTTYPINATFGSVEANTYTIEAQMLV